MTHDEYAKALNSVPGLKKIVRKYFDVKNPREVLLRMEFVLEGLHHNNIIARETAEGGVRYGDIFSDMLKDMGGGS